MNTKTKKKSRKFNLRKISQQRCYTYTEAAELLDRTPHTISTWKNDGWLKTIDDTRPYLIHGSELYACCRRINESFLKGVCAPGEIYCFGCKSGRTPKDKEATLLTDPRGFYKLEAECGECGTKLHRPIKEEDLFIFGQHLSIQQPDEMNRSGSPQPSYHQPFTKENKS